MQAEVKQCDGSEPVFIASTARYRTMETCSKSILYYYHTREQRLSRVQGWHAAPTYTETAGRAKGLFCIGPGNILSRGNINVSAGAKLSREPGSV